MSFAANLPRSKRETRLLSRSKNSSINYEITAYASSVSWA